MILIILSLSLKTFTRIFIRLIMIVSACNLSKNIGVLYAEFKCMSWISLNKSLNDLNVWVFNIFNH